MQSVHNAPACDDERKAILIGHPERQRAITMPVFMRLDAEPDERELKIMLALGYVIHREVCHHCHGGGRFYNTPDRCPYCEGTGQPDSLREAGQCRS